MNRAEAYREEQEILYAFEIPLYENVDTARCSDAPAGESRAVFIEVRKNAPKIESG